MRLPSKITPYRDSSLAKFSVVLEQLVKSDKLEVLFKQLKNITLKEYIEILDCLFALSKIDYNKETRSLVYVM